MKGIYIFWGMIVSTALGLLARYCYLNWENENVSGTVFQVTFIYCLLSSFWFFSIEEKKERWYHYVFIPAAWLVLFCYFVIIYPVSFINKLAENHLSEDEEKTLKFYHECFDNFRRQPFYYEPKTFM